MLLIGGYLYFCLWKCVIHVYISLYLYFIICSFSELGDGWSPAILNSEEEYNFLKEAMGLFISYEDSIFIGGSFGESPPFDYSTYSTEPGTFIQSLESDGLSGVNIQMHSHSICSNHSHYFNKLL